MTDLSNVNFLQDIPTALGPGGVKPVSGLDKYINQIPARMEAAEAEDKARQKKIEDAADAANISLGKAATAQEGLKKKFGDAFEPPKITKFTPPPPTDPVTMWGSPAMMIATLGSLFTRSHITSAFNAAAGVLNAYNKKDTEAEQQAFEEWKVNNDNAIKLQQYEMEAYKAALGDLDIEPKMRLAQVDTLAKAFKNSALSQVIEEGRGLEGAGEYVEKMAAAGVQLNEASIELGAVHGVMQSFSKVEAAAATKDPAQMQSAFTEYTRASDYLKNVQGKTASDTKQLPPLTEFMETYKQKVLAEGGQWDPVTQEKAHAEYNATTRTLTANETEKLQARVDMLGYSTSKIDEALRMLDKHIGAAGAAGRVTRLGEAVGNVFGSDATDRAQFRRTIEYLQGTGSQLMIENQGRPTAVLAQKIESIVGGLSFEDTTVNTRRSLQEVKTLYEQMQRDTEAQLSGTWTPPTRESPTANTVEPSAPSKKPSYLDAPIVNQ